MDMHGVGGGGCTVARSAGRTTSGPRSRLHSLRIGFSHVCNIPQLPSGVRSGAWLGYKPSALAPKARMPPSSDR